MKRITCSGRQCISGRKFQLCHRLQEFDTDELIKTCKCCSTFVAECCQHPQTPGGKLCNHFRLIFTDGACRNNGNYGATAGLGIAKGANAASQRSIPVTDKVDEGRRRTSQRAELLAAIQGLRFLEEDWEDCEESTPAEGQKTNWIIVTDSLYVVNGMTEWLPKWKQNGYRTAQGKRPSNLDLFAELDLTISSAERSHYVEIGFWHVGREYNTLADSLAKEAAIDGIRNDQDSEMIASRW